MSQTKPLKLSDVAKKTLPKVAQEQFTQFVIERVYSSLIHAGSRPRSAGLHVSSLLPDCMRKSAYSILFGRTMNLQGIYKTGIGTALHEQIKLLKVQEMPLEWEGIVTDGIDDYDPETGIFIDKKFTWGPPNWDIWPTNRRQLEYYKNMMYRNDIKATHGFVVYFDLSNPRVHVRYAKRIRSLDVLAKEMLSKRDILNTSRKTGILPERKIGTDCYFCGYARTCLGEVL